MMRAPLTILSLLLSLLALLMPGGARADPSDIAAAARSVVRVVLVSDSDGQYALEGHGSGFAVGPDLIVTNAHVVEPARNDEHVRIGIVPSAGKGGWFAKIVAVAPEKDLALLKLTEPGSLPPATLFTGAVSDGEDVYAVGYPGNVDLAQGLDVGDIVSPTSPVKTHGNVSSGRSSKAFETILHTAPLGAGNSGGPLLDACGRILGANSFGTTFSGGDSEFYFAVSTREIMRFLLAVGVQPHTAGNPCRSIAALDEIEAQHTAGEAARAADAQRSAAERRSAAQEQALHQALFEIAGERENLLAITGAALLLALACGGAAWALRGQGRTGAAGFAVVATGALLAGAVVAMLSRPGFDQVDERARDIAPPADGCTTAAPGGNRRVGSGEDAGASGRLVCTLLPERSRVTVSEMSDVPLDWGPGGCVNGDAQYALGPGGWFRLLVPDGEETATRTQFDPATATYRVERYFLDGDAMDALRTQRRTIEAPACGAGEDAARRFGEALASLEAMLPAQPNERLVYHCGAANEGAPQPR